MSVSDEQSWPLTPEGLTDWEVAFEDPDKGFIALITQANTSLSLKSFARAITTLPRSKDSNPD